MSVVLIPGLGYDDRIFMNLDLSEHQPKYLNWIEPKKKETLRDYSLRLYKDSDCSGSENIFIGHSLGGIVAQEIASISKPSKVILLSSIRSGSERPPIFNLVNPLRLDKLFLKSMGKKTIYFWGKYHGFDSKEYRALFRSMVSKPSNHYMRWALREISKWEGAQLAAETSVVQIHGTKDLTFPIKHVHSPTHVIPDGSHIMLLNKAIQVSEIIQKEINFKSDNLRKN